MTHRLCYRSSERDGPADVVEVDTSATTHGATITTRRYRFHEGTVLASRIFYLANLDATQHREEVHA